MEMIFTLYILQSTVNGSFYIGHTQDIKRRLLEHNSGQTKSTKPYKPWEIVFTKEYSTKSEASAAESFIKKKKSRLFIKNLILSGDDSLL